MPVHAQRRQLPRVSVAGFDYSGVYVLPLAQVPAPKTEAAAPLSATTAPVVELDAFRKPAATTEVAAAEHDFDTVIGLQDRRKRTNRASQVIQSSTAQRAAAVAAAAGLIFAAVNPGQGSDAAEATKAKADTPESADTRVSAAVGERIVVPKDAGAQMERVSYTKSENKDDALNRLMVASSGQTEVEGSAGALAHPVKNVRITSRFGLRPDPWGSGGTVTHIGQDYGYACGTEVYAAAAGVVTQSEWAGHSGNRVSVDHGNGLVTTYNHNTVNKVQVGDQVKRGDLVALGGSTGNSTGCHLHFEVIVDGTPVDPRDWLPAE
ncbi:M23 family metallopeptidase [Micrococcoides hystricis]|uniref:M23 family metallopeptidase n=1 Tax=Micrococcoides hystricis TaxID=1572761 RepID=A0ABV6P9N8_9MICC